MPIITNSPNPGGYEKVTLTGTYQTPDGTPHKGHVEIIPSERVIKDTTGDIILTGRVKVDLDAQGAFTVALPATDDPTLNPTGFGYTIAAKLHSSHPPAVSFSLPASLGATTVEDLTPVDPSTFAPTTTYAESSEVAALDSRVTTVESDVAGKADAADVPTTPADLGAEPAGLAQATQDTLAGTYVGRGGIVQTKGQRVETWGHSYAFGIGASDRSKAFGYLVAQALGLTERNEAVSGASLTSAPSGGSYVKTLQYVKPTALGVVDGSGATATADRGFTAPGGVYVAMYGINDVNELGGLTNQLEAFRDALRTVVSRWRAGVVFEDTDPTFTFNGAWSTHTVTDRNSGSQYRYTTTNASSYTITTPKDFPGGTIAIGIHSASPLGGGAVHTATYNGQDYVLDAHQRRAGGTGYTHTLRIPNVAAGEQTISVALGPVTTLTGVDYWQWEPDTDQAPLVVLVKQPYAVDYAAYGAGGTFGPPTDARVDDVNSVIDAVAAEFDGRVITVDTSSLNKDPSAFSADNLHPSDNGNRRIARLVLDAISAARFTVVAGGEHAPRVEYGTAPPTGNRVGYYQGDEVRNSAPTVLGTAGSQYVIHSWVCTVTGRPGTWVQRRMPTGT